MPVKRTPARGKVKPAEDAPANPVTELIVRRGAIRRFDTLAKHAEGMPVKLTWDRRESDRRSEVKAAKDDQREVERRQSPPFTWELADFVVALPPSRRKATRAARETRAPKRSKAS